MMQCLSQALSVTVRKPASAKPSDIAMAALLQLPHVDAEVVKKLKRRKVHTLKGEAEQGGSKGEEQARVRWGKVHTLKGEGGGGGREARGVWAELRGEVRAERM